MVVELANAPEGLATTEIMAAAGLVSRTAADKLLLRMVNDGEIKRLKRGFYGLQGAPHSPETPTSPTSREKREKGRLPPKPLKEQKDNCQSPNLPHLPPDAGGGRNRPRPTRLAAVESALACQANNLAAAEPIGPPEYLGPPGDDPADFLGDIPDFLDRRK